MILFIFLVIENNQEIKIDDEHSNSYSLVINGRTNLIFNLRPKKYVDR